MLVEIALVSILNGGVYDLETFQADYTPQSVNLALQECKKKERMIKPCLLRLERSEDVTVYVDLDNWYQFNVHNK